MSEVQCFSTHKDEEQVTEPTLEDVGTLAARASAKDAAKKKYRTVFDRKSEEISSQCVDNTLWTLQRRVNTYGESISDLLQRVERFTSLIDDRITTFDMLSVTTDTYDPTDDDTSLMRRKFLVCCENPSASTDLNSNDPSWELSGGCLRMVPTPAFLLSLVRYINAKTHAKALTAGFLASMIFGAPGDERMDSCEEIENLLTYLLKLIAKNYKKRDEDGDMQPCKVMIRTLRPDLQFNEWSKQRSIRAIMHENYRDDISHQWLMRKLAALIPTGTVVNKHFDGDLLKGAILMPNEARTEVDSEYSGGLFFFSGEVGNRRCGVYPFVYRARTGGISLFADDSWSVVHTGKTNVTELASAMERYVNEQIPLVSTRISDILALNKIVFTDDGDDMLERLLIAAGASFRGVLSNQDLKLWRVGVTAEMNALGLTGVTGLVLHNGFTRVTQTCDDPVRQISLEQLAGKMADLDWQAIATRASTISSNQVSKVFPE